MALFSYDRIQMMGNDTLLVELFDTRICRTKYSDELSRIVADYADIPEAEAKPNWYDSIKLKECFRKKSSHQFDEFTERYIKEYLNVCVEAVSCDRTEKMKVASLYTEGLLENGGLSTDFFVKSRGKRIHTKTVPSGFVRNGRLIKIKEGVEPSFFIYNLYLTLFSDNSFLFLECSQYSRIQDFPCFINVQEQSFSEETKYACRPARISAIISTPEALMHPL